LRKMQKCRFDF